MSRRGASLECLMRCGGQVRPVGSLWSSYDVKARRRVGICDHCGHVQLADLFSEEGYAGVNTRLFGRQYDPATASARSATRSDKTERTLERLAPFVTNAGAGGKLLDVGAGEGWSSDVARSFGLGYHVVEAQADLAAVIEGKGGTVAAASIDELLPEWRGGFRVILLRHTLEHFLDPIGSLGILAQCLSDSGHLYVAVPNFSKANPQQGFKTDYLRPVHISYFTANKVEWALHATGLRADEVHDEGEIWAVAAPGESAVEILHETATNRSRFTRYARANRWRDARRVVRFTAGRAFRRAKLLARVVRR